MHYSNGHYGNNPPKVRERRGVMDGLIGRLVAGTGAGRMAAEKAVSIIFDFLAGERPADDAVPSDTVSATPGLARFV